MLTNPFIKKVPKIRQTQPNIIEPDFHLLNLVLDMDTGNLLEYRYLVKGPDRKIWNKALANDLDCLAQGV